MTTEQDMRAADARSDARQAALDQLAAENGIQRADLPLPGSPEIVRVAQHIRTANDASGNPRRGWLVYGVHLDTRDSAWLGFHDEGYGGTAELRAAYPGVIELGTIDVPVSEYRAAKRVTS